MDELVGRTLGQYRIIEQIGEGGMATVYKAYQPGLDRYVAVKVLPPVHAKTPGFSERFAREAKAIAGLHHPNILPVYDFGQADGYSFIVMRYIEQARTLKDVMAESLTLEQVTILIEQVATALDHAHRRGVIHRDVKPANVLMDEDWALLTDFGLAKMTGVSVKLTGTGVGVGTPAYMSPEQGQGAEVDHRTDIYSLGIILFEMLTGKIPHQAETPFAIVLKRVTEPLPMPRSINPGIPEVVERVILKALATEPADRFENAGEMASALRKAAESLKEALIFEREMVVSAPGEEEQVVRTRPKAKPADVEEGEIAGEMAVTEEVTEPAVIVAPRKRAPAWAWLAVVAVPLLLVALVWVMLGGFGAEPTPAPEAVAQATMPAVAPPINTPALAVVSPTVTPTPAVPPTDKPTPTSAPTPSTLLSTVISPENAHQVVQVATWGKGGFRPDRPVTWSPDGSLLAVNTHLGIYFHDAETLEQYDFYPYETYSGDNHQYFLRWPGLPAEKPFSYLMNRVISKDGETMVVAGNWRTEKIKGIRVMNVADAWWDDEIAVDEDIEALAVSPDKSLFAGGIKEGEIRIWDAATHEQLRSMQVNTYTVQSLDFSPDGSLLASGDEAGTVRLWRVADGELVQMMEGHTEEVSQVMFSPDGSVVASAGRDGAANVWRVADGRLLRSLDEHKAMVISIAYSPDGQRLVTTSLDGYIRVWRVADGSLLNYSDAHVPTYMGLAFSPDGSMLAVGAAKEGVRLYDTRSGEILKTLKEGDYIWSTKFSPDGSLLAVGTYDGPVRLWSISEGSPVRTMEGHTDHVTDLAFTPDGKILASSSDDGTVNVWDVEEGELLYTLDGHDGEWVRALEISTDGAVLATGGWEGTVKLWKLADGSLIDAIEGYSGSVMAVNFSPDGWTLGFSSGDRTARLWNFTEGELINTLAGHESDVYNISFSPDGRLAATNSIVFDSTIRLWSVETGEQLHTLQLPQTWNWKLEFSPDGTMLASSAIDGVIRLWGIGEPAATPTPRFTPTLAPANPTATPAIPTRTRTPTPTPVPLQAGVSIKFHSYTPEEEKPQPEAWVAYEVTNNSDITFECVRMQSVDVAADRKIYTFMRTSFPFRTVPRPSVNKKTGMLNPGDTKYLVHASLYELEPGTVIRTTVNMYPNEECKGDDFAVYEFESTIP